MVDEIEEKVIAKFNMNRADYEQSFLARVDKCPELQDIEKFMTTTIELAAKGQISLPKTAIPPQLTPLKVFEMVVNSERTKTKTLVNSLAEYIKAGQMPDEEDPALQQELATKMKGQLGIAGLDELQIDDKDHHPMAWFMRAQNEYTATNKDGFKIFFTTFVKGLQDLMMALQSGQVDASNIDSFLAKFDNLGEAEIQKFREKVNPAPKNELTKIDEEPVEAQAKPEDIKANPETPAEEVKQEANDEKLDATPVEKIDKEGDADEVKVEEVKADEVKAEEVQDQEVQVEEAKVEETKAEEAEVDEDAISGGY